MTATADKLPPDATKEVAYTSKRSTDTTPPKLTGSFTNYYLVTVKYPQRTTQPPYQAECEDIITALGMTFDQGCEFKALWRTASAALGNGKPGRSYLDQAIYDAEKRIHYATRDLNRLKQLKSEQSLEKQQ